LIRLFLRLELMKKWIRWLLIIGGTVMITTLVFVIRAMDLSAGKNANGNGEEPINEVTISPSEIPTQLADTDRSISVDGTELIFVPEGSFLMGSEVGTSRDDEVPEHIAHLGDYWIYKYEVTYAQFAQFLNTFGNQEEDGALWLNASDRDLRISEADEVWAPDEGYEDHPVAGVTWYGARRYCEWVGGRLPTEAEWEKAARGEDGRIYPWGDEHPNCDFANFSGCVGYSKPVGSYPMGASPYGVLDMGGNVWEWVMDWYAEDYYREPPVFDPQGPEEGTYKVLRGGSRAFIIGYMRTSARNRLTPYLTFCSLGFRCVMDEVP
jgi:formylglycine-generating enzyme required for sulfatase activity